MKRGEIEYDGTSFEPEGTCVGSEEMPTGWKWEYDVQPNPPLPKCGFVARPRSQIEDMADESSGDAPAVAEADDALAAAAALTGVQAMTTPSTSDARAPSPSHSPAGPPGRDADFGNCALFPAR